jgi:hypothetical protein
MAIDDDNSAVRVGFGVFFERWPNRVVPDARLYQVQAAAARRARVLNKEADNYRKVFVRPIFAAVPPESR